MSTDPLEGMTIMRELAEIRREVEEKWRQLTRPDHASDILERTEGVEELVLRIDVLSPADHRIADLREVAFARAVAARTLGRSREADSALALVGVLSLSAAGTERVRPVLHFLEESAQQREEHRGLDPDFSSAVDSFPDSPGLPREQDSGACVEASEEPGTPSWDVQVGVLKRSPYTEQNDRLWDELIAACRSNLATARESSELSALQHCLGELMEIITDNPALASPHLRPEVIARAVALHRLHQRVMEELGDSIGARLDRNRFFQSVLSRLLVDVPTSISLSDRILIARGQVLGSGVSPFR